MRPNGPTHVQVKRAKYDNRIHWFVSEASEVSYVDYELKSPWRSYMIRLVHSTNVQFLLGCLLLIDVTILFTQVFLEAHFPPCYAILESAVCRNSSDINNDAGSDLFQVVCVGTPEYVGDVMNALYYISLSILAVFEAELLLLFSILKIQFFRNCGYYLDLVIVSISLYLEVIVHSADNRTAYSAVIIARIWRLIRIGHGIFAGKRRQILLGMLADDELPEKEPWEESSDDSDEKPKRRSFIRRRSTKRSQESKASRTEDDEDAEPAESAAIVPSVPSGDRDVELGARRSIDNDAAPNL